MDSGDSVFLVLALALPCVAENWQPCRNSQDTLCLSKLTNDTEQKLALTPGAFWDQTLKPKLEQLLAKKDAAKQVL